ncbi:MAG TPA: DUF58 domain-containing protein [Microbacteriaceae bacterium]
MSAAESKSNSQTLFGLRELRRAMVSALAVLGRVLMPLWRVIDRLAGSALRAVSPFGWLLLSVAAAAFLVSWLLGWAEFSFLGSTLLAGFVVALCFAAGRSTYAVSIDLNPRRVVAGDRAMGQLTATNIGKKTLLPTRMELPVGRGTAEFIVPRLTPGAENEDLFAVPTQRRALILAGPAVSVRGDQLGIIRRVMRWSDQIELFVHPQTTRLIATARGLVRDLEGQTTKVITNSDLAFHALRTYEPGDDIRNVHWRTSARTGQLMVRQYQETRRSQLLLLHSAEAGHYASDDEFELGVSVMASIACQVIREETELNVAWEYGRLRHRTVTAFLDDSCRIEPVERAHPTLRDFARASGAKLPAPSVVILVVGSRAHAHEVRSVSTLYGPDTELIAVQVALGTDSRLSKVGTVMIATVGKLADLPALLGRVGR